MNADDDVEPAVPADPPVQTEAARFRAFAIASVQQELAELAARKTLSAQPRTRRRTSGPSVVFTLRLAHDELAGVETRAALLGLGPRVWVRNLVRMALAERPRGVGSEPPTGAH